MYYNEIIDEQISPQGFSPLLEGFRPYKIFDKFHNEDIFTALREIPSRKHSYMSDTDLHGR